MLNSNQVKATMKAKKMVKNVNAVKKANNNKKIVKSIKTKPQWLVNGRINTKVLQEYYSEEGDEINGDDVSLARVIGYASLISCVPWHVNVERTDVHAGEMCYSTDYYVVFNDGEIWKNSETLHPKVVDDCRQRREELKFQFIRDGVACYSYILTRDIGDAVELRDLIRLYYRTVAESEKKTGEIKPSVEQVIMLGELKEYADSIRIKGVDAGKMEHYFIIGSRGDINIHMQGHQRSTDMCPELQIMIDYEENGGFYTIATNMEVHFNPCEDGLLHALLTDDLLKATKLRSMIEAYTNKYYIRNDIDEDACDDDERDSIRSRSRNADKSGD